MPLTKKKRQALIAWLESMPWWDELPYARLEKRIKALEANVSKSVLRRLNIQLKADND